MTGPATLTFRSFLTGRTFPSLREAQAAAMQEMIDIKNDQALVTVETDGKVVSSYRFFKGAVAYGWHTGSDLRAEEAAFGEALQP